jgi:hypothetical protein
LLLAVDGGLCRFLEAFEERAWRQHESFADHVWVRLIAAHEADHAAACSVLDARLEFVERSRLERPNSPIGMP